MAPAVATYESRDPSCTILYKVIAEHLETFLASLDADPAATGLPAYVQREFYDYLQCGILAHGFLRLRCDTCTHEMLLAFSCKRRGFCPSCAGRRMAQMAAHLVESVLPWVSTRQWVVSVPLPLRYWMSTSRDLTAQVHPIVRTTIAQYYLNQAVKRGVRRHNVQPGSVSFLQRCGGSLNLHRHFHVVFLEGVSLDRSDVGLTPRFVTAEPPSDADMATVLQKISRRVICTLRRLGYLEAGLDVSVATGDEPLRDTEPGLAAPWRPRSRSVSPVGNAPGRTSAASAQALARRTSCTHRPPLCPCQRLVLACHYRYPSASAGSVGAFDAVHSPRGRVACTACTGCERGSHVPMQQAVV
jgi:hypothetical protein